MKRLELAVPDCLKVKLGKLKNVEEPAILLIIDNLHFPKNRDWSRIVNVDDAGSFHSLVRVSRLHDGWQMLYSRCQGWLASDVVTNLVDHD